MDVKVQNRRKSDNVQPVVHDQTEISNGSRNGTQF